MMVEGARTLDAQACIRLAGRRMIEVKPMNLMSRFVFIIFNHWRPITLLSRGNHMSWHGYTAVDRYAEMKSAGCLPIVLF